MWHDTGTYANFLPAGGMSPIQPHIHIENAEAKRRFKNLLDVLGVTDQLAMIRSRKTARDHEAAEWSDCPKSGHSKCPFSHGRKKRAFLFASLFPHFVGEGWLCVSGGAPPI